MLTKKERERAFVLWHKNKYVNANGEIRTQQGIVEIHKGKVHSCER